MVHFLIGGTRAPNWIAGPESSRGKSSSLQQGRPAPSIAPKPAANEFSASSEPTSFSARRPPQMRSSNPADSAPDRWW